MKKLLNILGIILFSITITSCGNNENNEHNENSEKQQGIAPAIEKGLMSSHLSAHMQGIAMSYNFDRENRTVTDMTINSLVCRKESSGCVEFLNLCKGENIVFKSSERPVDVRSREHEFDRKISGELHFGDSKMKATLLFIVKGSDKGTSILGSIILSSDNFNKIPSDLTIYVKGKQGN